ncbi:MAG TPA: dihydrodipicolinate synthase family protein [Burkholderiaceae bacterium]|nr:dihydrodipicolinate synthase family protein [Burkholderiaceae bacterium]
MDPLPDWLHGLFAVLPTPMMADGRLDLESLDRLVDYYLERGAVGLVPASIAGEGDLLDEDERRCVVERVVRRSAERAPIVVGVLDDGLAHALAQARAAAECGASGLLVKPPVGCDAQAVIAHVGAIAEALRLPIILLDNPVFGAALPPGLVQALVDGVPEVCGIKLEEEPTPDKMALLRALLGHRIRIFGGLGGVHGLPELEAGADGFFTGYPYPEHLVEMIACARRGDRAAAAALYETLLPIATLERQCPAEMIGLRKRILCDRGVLRDAAVRPRHLRALTRQTVFPTSSATSSAPRLSSAMPTGRP